MKRFVARWVIDRCADDGKPLPSWVCRLVERDRELAEYHRRCRLLVARLREDAGDWISGGVRDAKASVSRRADGRPRSVTQAVVVTVALAASLLLLMWPFGRPDVPDKSLRIPDTVAVDSENARAVTDFVRSQSRLLAQLRDRSMDFGRQVAAVEVPTLSAARWMTDQIEDTATASGRIAGKSMALLRDGALRQGAMLQEALRAFPEILNRSGPKPEDVDER